MNDVLHLRRHMACNPIAFDAVRENWRRQMRSKCEQPKRDDAGRYARG